MLSGRAEPDLLRLFLPTVSGDFGANIFGWETRYMCFCRKFEKVRVGGEG